MKRTPILTVLQNSVRCCRILLWLGIGGLQLACQEEIVPEPYQPTHAHDAYRHALETAGLADTALGKDWLKAANDALWQTVAVTTPFQETFYVDPARAFAVAYRFSVGRGQRTEISLQLNSHDSVRIFLDLYRVTDEPPYQWPLVASASEKELRLEFEPRQDAEYVARLQPELLRGGQVVVTIRNMASLEFPVSGHTTRSILSGFGVPREGGRRDHHGVDIFARRHTPVLAATHGYIRRVGENRLGGNIIWLVDPERSLRLYYAHLQTQKVETDTWVKPGDVIGTVGNSGNARTTAPHLHFGIYRRGEGPLDPFPFLNQPPQEPESTTANSNLLGRWARVLSSGTELRVGPHRRARRLVEVPQDTPVQLLAAAGSYYRVRLPDGSQGYLPWKTTEPADRAVDEFRTETVKRLLEHPDHKAVTKALLPVQEPVRVLGSLESYWLVQTQTGGLGWLQRGVRHSVSTE